MKNYYIYKEGWLWVCLVCIKEKKLDQFIGNTAVEALENALKAIGE